MMIKRAGQNPQEAALRRYFARIKRPSHLAGIVLLGLGCLLVAAVMSSTQAEGIAEQDLTAKAAMGLGALFMTGGLAIIAAREIGYRGRVSETHPKPADSEVQAWLDQGFRKLVEHSQFMLSLGDAESSLREPLVIVTPALYAGEADWSLWKQGDDCILRFGYYRMVVIRLTERHLGAYECDYNFVRDVVLNEKTTEYHYHDVVSVSTREESYPFDYLPTGRKLTTKQEFSLSVASGEFIRVGVDSALIRQLTGAEGIPDSGAERAVATIRAMMRDKKGASYSMAA